MITREQFQKELISNMIRQFGFYSGFNFIIAGDAGDMLNEIVEEQYGT